MYTETLWLIPALGAFFGWGVTVFLPKFMLRSLPPLDLIVYGCVFFFLAALPLRLFMPPLQVDGYGIFYAAMAGISGTGGQLLYYFALRRGPLNIVSMVTALYPVLAAIIAFAFLGEDLTVYRGIGVAVGMAAMIVLVWQRGGDRAEPRGSWILPAVGALLIWSAWALFPSFALKTLSRDSVIFYETLGSLGFAAVMLFFMRFKIAFDKKAVLISAASNTISVVSVLCYLAALENGPIAPVVMMTGLYPVVTIILARIFLKEKLNTQQAGGIGLALGAIALLSL
jgi:transporter family protein